VSGTGTYLDALDADLDLEFENADVVETEALFTAAPERSSVPFPSDAPAGFADWREFFAEAKASVTSGNEEEIAAPVPEVRETRAGSVEDLVRGPKKAALAALSMGWDLDITVTEVYTPPTLYKHASEEHSRGDVRYPERHETFWALTAFAPGKVALGFHAVYVETETAKGGRGFSFDAARAADPLGMPLTLEGRYKPGKAERLDKRETAESLAARQREMDAVAARAAATYNDNAAYLERRPLFTAAKEFDLWLGDYVALLQPTEEETE
jgi:hypothetical protein